MTDELQNLQQENGELKARIIATNEFVLDLVEQSIKSKVMISELRAAVETLQKQLLEKTSPPVIPPAE